MDHISHGRHRRREITHKRLEELCQDHIGEVVFQFAYHAKSSTDIYSVYDIYVGEHHIKVAIGYSELLGHPKINSAPEAVNLSVQELLDVTKRCRIYKMS